MKKFSNQSIWRTLLLFAFVTTYKTVVLAQQWAMDDIAEDNEGGVFSGIFGAILTLGLIWLLGSVFRGKKKDNRPTQSNNEGQITEPAINYINEDEKKQKENIKTVLPQAIDMGLSVKWASFNLGAYKPSDIGSLFYWAENSPSKKRHPIYDKINVHAIGNIGGNSRYDAATNLLGPNWRLPSDDECHELIDLCNWEEKNFGEIKGRLITGPSGNSIFLPYNQKTFTSDRYVSGHYWSSTPHFAYADSSKELGFGESTGKPAQVWCGKANGCLYGIRPVFCEIPENTNDPFKQYDKNTAYEKINLSMILEDESLIKNYEEQCVSKQGENYYIDEHGVKYSSDGKRLLDGNSCDCRVYTIKEGTEFICDDAFYIHAFQGLSFKMKIRTLEKLILPSSLIWFSITSIPDNCSIESHCKHYSIIDNLFVDNRRRCVIKCLNKHVNKVEIYEPIEEIGNSAFFDCKDLEEVVLPESLKTIGASAFRNCESLTSVNLPNSIDTISECAFFNCKTLRINRLPRNLSIIGNTAFQWCIIDGIIIPKSIKEIGKAPFSKDIKNTTSESSRYIIVNSLLIDSNNNELIQLVDSSIKQVSIPNNITKIREDAFIHTDIEAISIPSSVKNIGESVFWGCKELSDVQFECEIERLPNSFFAYCSSLISFTVPESIKVIEAGVFNHCKLLQEVNLNNGLEKISSCAFIECPSLTSILIPESVEEIGDRNKYNPHFFRDCRNLHELYYDAKNADISGLPSCITKLVIGEHVEVLPASLLSNNSNIESFTIPANVRKVSKACISKCPQLHEIIILSKNIILEEGWIRDCDNLVRIHIPKDSYDSLLPMLPVREGLKIKKIYDHHFMFFKW